MSSSDSNDVRSTGLRPPRERQEHPIPAADRGTEPVSGTRFDAPHAALPPPHLAQAAGTPGAASPSMQAQMRMLAEVTQLASGLQSQLEELDRREQSLAAQLSELEREQRTHRLRAAEFQERSQQLDRQHAEREAALQKREQESASREAELARRESDLALQQRELETEREEYRSQLEAELDVEKRKLRESRIACEEELEKLQQQKERLLEDHRHKAAEQERRQAEEFQRRQFDLHREYEQRTAEFESSKLDWRKQCDRERQELDQLRLDVQTESSRNEREKRDVEREFLEQKAVLENRIRFQQEHLERLRMELDRAQGEFRRQQQFSRMVQEQDHTVLRLRARQLEHFRRVLEEREKSVERERQIVDRAKRSLEREQSRRREEIDREQKLWEERRQIESSDIHRQQNMLALHAENVEARRTRLEQLRAELEETHRQTLEMKMAIAEAWTQLIQHAGVDDATARVEQARQLLSMHYRNLRDDVRQQREEVLKNAEHLERQRAVFEEERQSLSEWMLERDRQVRDRQGELAEIENRLEQREIAWRTLRDRWLHERIEAEELIRNLLRQLTDLNDPALTMAAYPAGPAYPALRESDESIPMHDADSQREPAE